MQLLFDGICGYKRCTQRSLASDGTEGRLPAARCRRLTTSGWLIQLVLKRNPSLIENGSRAGLIIPPDYSRNLQSGVSPGSIYLDGSDPRLLPPPIAAQLVVRLMTK
jgi:hypothetical protein